MERHSAVDAATTSLAVSVTVEPISNGWRLHLVLQDRTGVEHRELDAEDCPTVVEAAAFITATALEHAAASQATSEAKPEPELELEPPPNLTPDACPERPVPPSAPIAPEPRQPSPDADPPSETVVLGFTSGVQVGALPVAHPFGGLNVMIEGRRLSGGLEARYGGNQALRGPQGAYARLQLWSLGGVACVRSVEARVRAAACGGVEGGAVHGAGFRAPVSLRARLPWLATHAGPRLRIAIRRRVGLVFASALVVPLVRPRFGFVPGPTFAAGPVGARVSVGLMFFP